MVYPRVSSNVRIIRILEVFLKLLRRESFNSESLARDYNVTSRTIKRDIDLLRDIPIPVKFDPVNNTYFLNGNGTFLLNRFTPMEAMLLLMGIASLNRIPFRPDEACIDSLSKRLYQFLTEKERVAFKAYQYNIDAYFTILAGRV
jgi:predicted DNA-binding transcriptional regulator YafY